MVYAILVSIKKICLRKSVKDPTRHANIYLPNMSIAFAARKYKVMSPKKLNHRTNTLVVRIAEL